MSQESAPGQPAPLNGKARRPLVLTCGHVTLDQTAAGQVPGGSACYGSRALQALGAQVRVLTAAAPDFPTTALDGVEARILPAGVTTRFVNVYAAGGTRSQRVLSAAPPLDPAALPASWRQADALFLATVLAEVDVPAFRSAVQARVFGLGVQGLLRVLASDGTVEQPRWEPPPGWLDGVDVAFLGEDDVVGQGDLVARLARQVPLVVFTHGAQGCELISGGRVRRVGVFKTEQVEPTGAGDVFAAGFLYAMAGGADPIEAARLGAAAASVVIEAPGGDALPRVGEAHQRVASVPVLD